MKRLLLLLAAAAVAGTSGCGGAATAGGSQPEQPSATGQTDRITQSGVSMQPTVKVGQVVTVQEVGRGYQPRRGDIVLFRPTGGKWGDRGVSFLKRVVAVGGDTVACCDSAGKVTINGAPLDEPYVADDAPLDLQPRPDSCEPRRFGPVAVANDAVFVMGDNRANSNDSRCNGTIPVASVTAIMIS